MTRKAVHVTVTESKRSAWDVGAALYDEIRALCVKSPDRSFNAWLRNRKLGELQRAKEALYGLSRSAGALRVIQAVEREFGLKINTPARPARTSTRRAAAA